MRILFIKNTVFLTLLLLISCSNKSSSSFNETKGKELSKNSNEDAPQIIVGANRTEVYFPLLQNKNVGVVTNKSGLIFKTEKHSEKSSTHLIDSLIFSGINVKRVFSPEHGFRGDKDAGEMVKDGKDSKTGLDIISLHGKNKKPSQTQLKDLDIIVFDIQDVGVRFYTYISTLTYVMEAAAEKGIPVIVLDRPNPNAHYVDGPTLEKKHSSFLGMHEVPLVYGMTIGEYARMVNGEGWLQNDLKCHLTVIELENWDYTTQYSLPTRPSPNLPNDKSINLYPSLGLFEGTTINAGRGTEMQFQIFGSPDFPIEKYSFVYTPQPNFGSKEPKYNGERCNGLDLRDEPYLSSVNLEWLVNAYNHSTAKTDFFKTSGFTIHAGTEKLQKQIENGMSFDDIKQSWQEDLDSFKIIRNKYLLYAEE